MNLAKVFLLAKGASVLRRESHGLTHRAPTVNTPSWTTQVLDVHLDGGRGLFPRFVDALQPGMQLRPHYRVAHLMQQIVGIHRVWQQFADKSSCFARVDFSLHEPLSQSGIFAAILSDDPSPRGKEILTQFAKLGNWKQTSPTGNSRLRFESPTLPVGRGRGHGYRAQQVALADQIRPQGVHAIVTPQGYRYYVSDLRPNHLARVPQLAAIYAVMFYLGSITRYRPHDFDRYIDGQSHWLVSELLVSQPTQFVYLLASHLADNEVVLPLSDIGIRAPAI